MVFGENSGKSGVFVGSVREGTAYSERKDGPVTGIAGFVMEMVPQTGENGSFDTEKFGKDEILSG